MKNRATSQRVESRASIISTVQTPLGFFVLVVLVVEAILGGIAGLSAGDDRSLAIKGMLAITAGLVFVVAFIAFFRPKNLGNQPDIGPSLSITPNMRTNIEGEYRAGNDLKYKVTLTRLTGDYYKVHNPDWEGVGFFDGEYYYGVFKMNDRATPPERRGNWGAHRNRLSLGKESPFEVFGIEMNEDNEKYDDFHEVEGWNKDSK